MLYSEIDIRHQFLIFWDFELTFNQTVYLTCAFFNRDVFRLKRLLLFVHPHYHLYLSLRDYSFRSISNVPKTDQINLHQFIFSRDQFFIFSLAQQMLRYFFL